ncbi:MAG TPA: secretin and TonB N-terminal domain-containing protein [Methylophilus sp.]
MKLYDVVIKPMQDWSSWMLLMLMTLLAGCAFAPWERPVKEATPEATLAKVEAQFHKHAENTQQRQMLYATQEAVVTELMDQANQTKAAGKRVETQLLYDRVLKLDPHYAAAIAGKEALVKEEAQAKTLAEASALAEASQLAEASRLVKEVLLQAPQHKEALALAQTLNARVYANKLAPPTLQPAINKPVTLELRDANIKVLFEALSRVTGINFVLDKDIKPDTKASVFIKKMSIEDAIDMVLASTGLQKKILSENSVLVFPNIPQKQKDYKELVVRSFYLTNAGAKQISDMLKMVLKIKDIYVDERLNMLVMRDRPEVVRVAEKLVRANDIADPEVMLDIEVLEVNRNRLQELGIVYPNQLSVISPDSGLTLATLKQLTSETIGVSPNPSLRFRKTSGDANLLSNPRIRVKNNEKAKILVGDKVPIITTTSTANVGISESVTYVDVGLKLEVEPKVTLDNYVNIKVGLEVSSLGERTVTNNGATVFTIGTRNANTVLRLKSGETQILAGLILDDERKNANKLPGLGDIPLIGRLFSNQEDRKSKTEIILAITPRVLGNIQVPDAALIEYWSGTEAVISDKPQVTLPSVSVPTAPQTTLERMREQMRNRQQLQDPADDEDTTPSETEPNQMDSSQADPIQTETTPAAEVNDVPVNALPAPPS